MSYLSYTKHFNSKQRTADGQIKATVTLMVDGNSLLTDTCQRFEEVELGGACVQQRVKCLVIAELAAK